MSFKRLHSAVKDCNFRVSRVIKVWLRISVASSYFMVKVSSVDAMRMRLIVLAAFTHLISTDLA